MDKLTFLYPGIKPLALRVLSDVKRITNRKMRITDSWRSIEEQDALYAKGRTLEGGRWVITDRRKIVTNSRGGTSWHGYGLAFDCCWVGADPYLEKDLEKERLWNIYGDIVNANGLHWGGDFRLVNGVRDLPHAEQAFGLKIDQAQELYTINGISAVWAYLDKLRGVTIGEGWSLPDG